MPREAPDRTDAVHCFGVGEGWPCADRNQASYLLQIGGVRYLLDAGDGLNSRYKASGRGPDGVDRVFLSHMHSDHVGGFSLFVQSLWLEKRGRRLPVHLPRQGIPALQAWLEATMLFPGLIGFPIAWEPLAGGVPLHLDGLTVTPHPTTHLESLRRAFQHDHPGSSFEAFGFRVEGQGKRFAYSGDLGGIADLEPLVAGPLDLLLCEASHVPLPELLELLRGRPIGHVVFVHLERNLWADRERILAECQAALGPIRCSVARDGDAIPF